VNRKPARDQIFVFGSNLAGRHGLGAAKTAKESFGAKYGQGEGLQGRSYAIPTKDAKLKTLPIDEIEKYVDTFLELARTRTDLSFFVTRIGCGLAGYHDEDIAPLFEGAPANCDLPKEWRC
jgi:hypothetical protein